MLKSFNMCLCALLLFLFLMSSHKSAAASFQIGSTGGLMQQPTSNYYLATYGAFIETATDSKSVIARASYVERPEFESGGYRDQERAMIGLIGTKVTKAKDHGLYAYIGGGKVEGYIKSDEETSTDGENIRTFGISGLAAAISYMFEFSSMTIGANHQTFIGYANKDQFEAKVAWPYNFYEIQIGYLW